MAAKMADYSENDIYTKCLYIVFNVDSVEVCVVVKCNEQKHTDLIKASRAQVGH